MDKAAVEEVPNKSFIPDAVHCAKTLKHFGICAWNKTLVVHSSKFGPHASDALIQSVYASIHSALSSKLDEVVVEPTTLVVPVKYDVIVGKRRDAVVAGFTTPGRAVNA